MIFYEFGQPIGAIIARQQPYKPKLKFGYLSASLPSLCCLDIEIGGLLAKNGTAANQIKSHMTSVLNNQTVDLIKLDYLSPKNPMWNLVTQDIQHRFPSISTDFAAWITHIADPASGKRLQSRKTGKTRKELRRRERKLNKHFSDQVTITCFQHPSEVNDFISQTDEINQKTYQYAIDVGIKNNANWRSELSFLAKTGYFRGYILHGDKKPISYKVGAAFNEYYWSFATGFDRDFDNLSPGNVLSTKVMDSLFSEGVYSFHYGFDDAEYKQRFGTECIEGGQLFIYSKSPRYRLISFSQKSVIHTE